MSCQDNHYLIAGSTVCLPILCFMQYSLFLHSVPLHACICGSCNCGDSILLTVQLYSRTFIIGILGCPEQNRVHGVHSGILLEHNPNSALNDIHEHLI